MTWPLKLPGALLRPGGQAALAQALTVAAAAALAGQLAIVAWRFVPGAHRPAASGPVPTAPAPADVGSVLQARLFGAVQAVPQTGENAPQTRVPLILAGTLASTDPKAGLAIIGETAQNAKVYAVGGSVPGGMRLHEVYADRVVLENGGALETLLLPRKFAGGAGIGQPAAVAGNTEPPLAESVQRLVAQGPEVVGEVLRPMPTYANGQLKGFRVYAGRDRRKFAKLGLQAGDLVTSINGVPLADPQRGLEILRTLGSGGAANVTVERGGSSQQISIDAAQLSAATEGVGAPVPPTGRPMPAAPPPLDDPASAQ